MDYSVFRRKKPAPKKEDAPPPPPPPPVVEPAPEGPEPMPVREENGHRYMSDWGGFGEGYMDMDRLFSNPRINNIDIANAQRVRIHFRDYYNYDQPDTSYYDVRMLPFSALRHDHYPDHHYHDHYGHGHWPAALPPPRAATRYMLPPPPPPPSHQRYYGHGYEHQYALPPPPAAYHPSYFY